MVFSIPLQLNNTSVNKQVHDPLAGLVREITGPGATVCPGPHLFFQIM